jgi:hypothetical protein
MAWSGSETRVLYLTGSSYYLQSVTPGGALSGNAVAISGFPQYFPSPYGDYPPDPASMLAFGADTVMPWQASSPHQLAIERVSASGSSVWPPVPVENDPNAGIGYGVSMAEQGGRALLAWTYWVDDPYQGGVTLLSLARVDVSP